MEKGKYVRGKQFFGLNENVFPELFGGSRAVYEWVILINVVELNRDGCGMCGKQGVQLAA